MNKKQVLKPLRYILFFVLWTIRIPVVGISYFASVASLAAFVIIAIMPWLLGREIEQYGYYLAILGIGAVAFAAFAFIYDVVVILLNPAPVNTFLGQ